LPVLIEKGAHGRKILTVSSARVKKYLKLDRDEAIKFLNIFADQQKYEIKLFKMKVDYNELAATFQRIMDSGVVTNRADLARYLGVSRAYVTKVMNRYKDL
jgi:CRP-like cAMP-binding protein